MEIYSMLDYNTIFFAECQDGNGFLFHFINFAQTQVIFYSRLTSKNIPFFIICAVVFNQDHCGESCASSCNPSPSQKTVKNCCPIYKKAAEDAPHLGKLLGGIRLACLFFSVVPFSSAKNRSTFFCARTSSCISFRALRYGSYFFVFCGKLFRYTPNTVFVSRMPAAVFMVQRIYSLVPVKEKHGVLHGCLVHHSTFPQIFLSAARFLRRFLQRSYRVSRQSGIR